VYYILSQILNALLSFQDVLYDSIKYTLVKNPFHISKFDAMQQVYVGIFSLFGSLVAAHYYSGHDLSQYQQFSILGDIISLIVLIIAILKYFNKGHLELLDDKKKQCNDTTKNSNLVYNSSTSTIILEENEKEKIITKEELHGVYSLIANIRRCLGIYPYSILLFILVIQSISDALQAPYFYQICFHVDTKTLNVWTNQYSSYISGYSKVVGYILSPKIFEILGTIKTAYYANCCLIVSGIVSVFIVMGPFTGNPSQQFIWFVILPSILSGFSSGVLSNLTSVLFGACMDYEALYSGQRKVMVFITTSAIIPLLFFLVCTNISTIGLQALGFESAIPNDDDDSYYPPQSKQVVTYAQITNLILPILFQIMILFAYNRFPINHVKMIEVQEELTKRDLVDNEDYKFHDPISPSYITKYFDLSSLISLFDSYGSKYIECERVEDTLGPKPRRKVVLAYLQQRLTFYYSFSMIEMLLLQHMGGKSKVQKRFIIDTCLLSLYTVIILIFVIINVIQNLEIQVTALLVILFIILPFTVYEILRWKAIYSLFNLPPIQVIEESITISKLRRIESTSTPFTDCQLFLRRLPLHLLCICLVVLSLLLTFIPSILPFTLIN